MEASGRSVATWRIWLRMALVVAAVGVVLALGKAIPLVGLDLGLAAEIHRYCSGATSNWHGVWLISCPGPHLPHTELGGTALLGAVALAVFALLFMRRWFNRRATRR